MSATTRQYSARETLDALRRRFSPQLALVYGMNGSGAVETSGEGARLRLSDGRVALDFGSYAVTLLGQRHPAVVAAVRRELDRLPVSTRVLGNGTTAALGEALAGYADPERLTKVWLGLNGCDAVEAALKLARLATGRTRVLAVEGAYHGKSLGALAATWSARYRGSLGPLLGGVTHVPPDVRALPAAFAGEQVAAVIVEPVQGEGGVRPLEPAFLRALERAAREHGAFLIADEIQTGLRRCGPRLVSTDAGLRPDAVLLGKALGGGVQPLSAVLATQELYAPLAADPFVHTTTFSGHPLGAAAGSPPWRPWRNSPRGESGWRRCSRRGWPASPGATPGWSPTYGAGGCCGAWSSPVPPRRATCCWSSGGAAWWSPLPGPPPGAAAAAAAGGLRRGGRGGARHPGRGLRGGARRVPARARPGRFLSGPRVRHPGARPHPSRSIDVPNTDQGPGPW